MTHAESQVTEDREVFREFTDSEGGLGTCWDSVDHGHEPVPDIVCRSGSTVTYFELTQIDPEVLHKLVAWNQSNRGDLLSNRYGLTETELAVFQAKYQGYALDLGKPEDSMHPDGAVLRVFKFLLKHDPRCDFPQGPEGELLVLYDDIAPDGELDVTMHRLQEGSGKYMDIWLLPGVSLDPRPHVTDPIIELGGVASRNPDILRIRRKVQAGLYRDESGQQAPLVDCFHLLLWTDISGDGFLDETSEYLESADGRAMWNPVFGSVWLFDRVHKRIVHHAICTAHRETSRGQ
jgi:hypothetical protein